MYKLHLVGCFYSTETFCILSKVLAFRIEQHDAYNILHLAVIMMNTEYNAWCFYMSGNILA